MSRITPPTTTTAAAAAGATTTTTTTAATIADTTAQNAVKQYENFLDDPFNMAMYVVLPAMVFVYGGCCVIYCVAKLHRFCRRRARRRAKQQRRLLHKDSEDSDDDHPISARAAGAKSSLSVVDVGDPVFEPVKPVNLFKPAPPPVPVKPARPAVPVKPARPAAVPLPPRGPLRSSREASSSARGVQPGYVKGQDLQQHMQHLDDQLKAAFHMISEEPKAIKSRPDLCARTNENKRSITRRSGKGWIQFYVSDQ